MTQEAPHTPPKEFSARIGYHLKETQSLLRSRMDETLRPIGLTTPQYVCLELLNSTPGASNAELARAGFVTRQTMNSLLKALAERGLIKRATRASKGRALPTTLTPAGKRVLERASKRILDIETRIMNQLSEEQRRALIEALSLCNEGLREP